MKIICPKCKEQINRQDYYYNYDHSISCDWAFRATDEIKGWRCYRPGFYLISNKETKTTMFRQEYPKKQIELKKYFPPVNINRIIQIIKNMENFQ